MTASKRLLLVETNAGYRHLLRQIADPEADVESTDSFASARSDLLLGGFDLLITNLRLRAHNGLHLVYLMRAAGVHTRAVVYTEEDDASLAREAQRAGAFYEHRLRLPLSLPGYLHADLPLLDRRDPTVLDRRAWYRGGRRRSDLPLSGLSPLTGITVS